MMMIQKMKGTEDILPNQSATWQYVEDVARDIFDTYMFKEIRTPMFESLELFQRGVGDTTDIVSKEMYQFKDKGDRDIALRPEGTAPVVRAYVEHKLFGPEHAKPLKVYYMGPMFRFERPQAGRQRQFTQIGVEVLGSSNPLNDAETIAMAWDLFNELGLSKIKLCLNSLGKTQDRQAYRQALIAYYEPHLASLSEDSQRRLHTNPLRILDSKDEKDKQFLAGAPKITDYLSEESRQHFDQVCHMLDALDIPYVIDPLIVRGLDYYQDTIFEIIVEDDAIGAQSTICGGGRYDGLVEDLGGPQTPGFGSAIGMERLLLLLEQQAVSLPIEDDLDVYVMTIGDQAVIPGLQIMQAIRQAGYRADTDVLQRSMKSQFKTLAKLGTKLLITIGEDELAKGKVQIKNQANGKQAEESISDILEDFAPIYRKHTMDTSVIDNFFEGE